MRPLFPSAEWLSAFHDKLNEDSRYAEIARNWEGDLFFVIESDDHFDQTIALYFDLWHGESRAVEYDIDPASRATTFTIAAPYSNWLKILKGELNPIQAMATMKLRVKGNMAYMMRNVPTVLEFARCAQETSFHH